MQRMTNVQLHLSGSPVQDEEPHFMLLAHWQIEEKETIKQTKYWLTNMTQRQKQNCEKDWKTKSSPTDRQKETAQMTERQKQIERKRQKERQCFKVRYTLLATASAVHVCLRIDQSMAILIKSCIGWSIDWLRCSSFIHSFIHSSGLFWYYLRFK